MDSRDTDRVQVQDKERRKYMGTHIQGAVAVRIGLVVRRIAAGYIAHWAVPRVG
jgi:hypothetical protein